MKPRSLRIAQVAAPAAAGGLGRVVEALAVGHQRRGHDVTVATPILSSEASHPFIETLSEAGLRVHELRIPSARAYLQERSAIAHLLRQVRPDVVHTHGYRRDILVQPLAARQGIPTVTTVHGVSKMGGLKGAWFEWLQRRAYHRFDAVVAVSKALFEETLADGIAADRLHLIRNAWSGLHEPMSRKAARQALDLDEEARVVGWVGRFIRVKGGDVFLRALSRLPKPRPIGVMIGYGPEASALRHLKEELGLGHDLRFYPDITDAGRYFSAFDTYVLSSRSEGLPIVILEAMAAGTPIVATRVGGVTEAVGETEAWIVRPDDPEALANAIAGSLRDRAAALTRAAHASERLGQHFSLDTFLDRYEEVYRALVEN